MDIHGRSVSLGKEATYEQVGKEATYEQVPDACSILGYTGPRLLDIQCRTGFETLRVGAGDIVVMISHTGHRAHAHSAADSSPLLFMYSDRSWGLPADNGLKFAPVDPVVPRVLNVKYLVRHDLLASMKANFADE